MSLPAGQAEYQDHFRSEVAPFESMRDYYDWDDLQAEMEAEYRIGRFSEEGDFLISDFDEPLAFLF